MIPIEYVNHPRLFRGDWKDNDENLPPDDQLARHGDAQVIWHSSDGDTTMPHMYFKNIFSQ